MTWNKKIFIKMKNKQENSIKKDKKIYFYLILVYNYKNIANNNCNWFNRNFLYLIALFSQS